MRAGTGAENCRTACGACDGIHPAAQREGVRVLLDGCDGDLVVSYGYGRLTELLRSLRWIALGRELRRARGRLQSCQTTHMDA